MLFKKFIPAILIIFVLTAGTRLLFIDINKPFWGHHDWNSVVYSNIARNYIKYGYIDTKLGQVTNVDYVAADSFSFISHYPPLLPILISFSFYLFGDSEMSARLTIVFFSLILICSIYLIGKELKSVLFGIFAASISIFYPIFLYFGKMPVHDTVVPALSTLGFWLYLRYLKNQQTKHYLFLVSLLVVSGFINWSAFYLAFALVFHQLITKYPKSVRIKIFLLLPVSVIVFFVHLLHLEILGAKSGGAFGNVLVRMNPYLTAGLYGFSLFKYIKGELLLLKVYYTLPVFLGSACFVLWCIFAFIRKKLSSIDKFLLSVLLYGAIQLIVFSQLSFIHDYMIYYLFPLMSLSAAYIIFKVFERRTKSILFAAFLIAVLFLVVFNQYQFTRELILSSMHKRGVFAAQIINKQVPSGQSAFVTSNSYKEFEEVFVGYYADRNVGYGEILPLNYQSSYKVILRPKDHDTLQMDQKAELDRNYQKFEDDYFIWYRVN